MIMEQQENTTGRQHIQQNNHDYFQLIELVGSAGRYQIISLIFWCALWFIAGQMLLGTAILFYSPPYQNCPLDIEVSCNEFVCSLPIQKRHKYASINIKTIATQFGDFRCQNSYQISFTSTFLYFGAFLGYSCVSWMNDNLGRRKSILTALSIALIGITILGSSVNLTMVKVGLLLMGFGIDPASVTVFYFIAQTTQNNKRQRYSTIIQLFFPLAGTINVVYYIVFQNWRLIYWIFFFFPTATILVLVYLIIQETPPFLIMFNSTSQSLKSLKTIAHINKSKFFQVQQNQTELHKHINNLKQQFQIKQQKSDKKYMNFTDMFKYLSIRHISIFSCILSFNIFLMYYGPFMLLQKYNLNIYLSAVVVTSSEILVYPIQYFCINKMKRIFWAKLFFSVATVSAIVLFFTIDKDAVFYKYLQMLMIFIFRFCISFQFAMFAIHQTEYFPAQIRGMAIGFTQVIGNIAAISCPLLFKLTEQHKFPSMIIFAFTGMLSILISLHLPQTLDKKPEDQLEEFKKITEQQKQI